ncbi:MAG: hypothetical protein JW940_25235 [Polyangiaceae bacterium]|nr:hypothetical protein [Polyangiaceae bacterium]
MPSVSLANTTPADPPPLQDIVRCSSLPPSGLGISADQAPIVEKSETKLVFHSKNPCSTLQACELLGLDTRLVCRHHNERATDALVKCIDPRLRFARNYDRLRPHCEFCEEMIILGGH